MKSQHWLLVALLRLSRDILLESMCSLQGKEESCTALVLSGLIREQVQLGGCGKVQSKILPLAAFICYLWLNSLAYHVAEREAK